MHAASKADDSAPCVEIGSDRLGPAAALDTFRAAIHTVFDCRPADDASIDDFRCRAMAWHLGKVMLGSFSATAMTFERSSRLVAISGIDHVLVQLYLEGSFVGEAGGRTIRVEPGDICFFDMTSTLSTRATAFHNLSVMVPRSYFEAALVDVAALHGRVLPGAMPTTQVVADFLLALESRIPKLSLHDASEAASATVSLVAALVRQGQACDGAKPTGRSSPFRSASLYIERHLTEVGLTPDAVARACNMSRASLYRLFEPLGGVSQYIRRSRLIRAAVALSSIDAKGSRLFDIAFQYGFPNESSFARAFRAQFGMSPGEARRMANRNWAAEAAEENNAERRLTTWLRTL